MGAAARSPTGRGGRVDTRGGRPRPFVLARAPPRCHGDAARTPPRFAHAPGDRRRPLDGRRLVRAAPISRNPAPDATMARLHDEAPGRGRLRRGDGNPAAACADAAAGAAAGGGRESSGHRRIGRPAPRRGRGRRAHGARRGQPPVPAGARECRREGARRRGPARDGRVTGCDPNRPARARRSGVASLGVGARCLVLGVADRRRPRGRPARRGRLRGMGPARRIRRARSGCPRGVPVQACAHP